MVLASAEGKLRCLEGTVWMRSFGTRFSAVKGIRLGSLDGKFPDGWLTLVRTHDMAIPSTYHFPFFVLYWFFCPLYVPSLLFAGCHVYCLQSSRYPFSFLSLFSFSSPCSMVHSSMSLSSCEKVDQIRQSTLNTNTSVLASGSDLTSNPMFGWGDPFGNNFVSKRIL